MIKLFLCLLLAAGFKSIADTLFHHFSTSIFRNLSPKFWNPNESWKHVKLIFGYRPDAWHLANSAMIIFFCLAAAPNWWMFLIMGAVFNAAFNLSYNKVLRKKT